MTTAHYVLRPRAQRDLEEIWDFTANFWGVAQAESYLRQIKDTVEELAGTPQIGRACDEIRVGYRKFPVGSHIVFYRVIGDGIEIVRFLHQRMDIGRNI